MGPIGDLVKLPYGLVVPDRKTLHATFLDVAQPRGRVTVPDRLTYVNPAIQDNGSEYCGHCYLLTLYVQGKRFKVKERILTTCIL